MAASLIPQNKHQVFEYKNVKSSALSTNQDDVPDGGDILFIRQTTQDYQCLADRAQSQALQPRGLRALSNVEQEPAMMTDSKIVTKRSSAVQS